MADGGFIKVWRKMLDSDVMQDDWLCRLWMWCLLSAKWNGGKRGQFETSRSIASDILKVSGSKWYRGIMRLRDLGCIDVEAVGANSNRTRITICKFKTYQDLADEREQQVNSKRTASEQQANNLLLIDEEKKEEKELPSGQKERVRVPLWDAVCEVFKLNPVTKSDRSRIGKVVADLKAKNATPDDVHVRFGRYIAAWPSLTPTPEALVKHWDTFATERIGTPGRGNSVDLMGTVKNFMAGGG